MRPERFADAKRTAPHGGTPPPATTIDQRSLWFWWTKSRIPTTTRPAAQTSGNATARRDESLLVRRAETLLFERLGVKRTLIPVSLIPASSGESVGDWPCSALRVTQEWVDSAAGRAQG